jgi:hypothetical protein
MKIEYTLVFFMGFLSCAFLFYLFYFTGVEIPFSEFGGWGFTAVAPSDWISEEDIILFDDMVVIRINKASVSSYADTGSMKPVFDKGSNGIRVVPDSEGQINVGDIVSYDFNGMLIVHRVVEKGVDSEGVYFVVQGDNNSFSDGKIRFSQIKYVTVGVIY